MKRYRPDVALPRQQRRAGVRHDAHLDASQEGPKYVALRPQEKPRTQMLTDALLEARAPPSVGRVLDSASTGGKERGDGTRAAESGSTHRAKTQETHHVQCVIICGLDRTPACGRADDGAEGDGMALAGMARRGGAMHGQHGDAEWQAGGIGHSHGSGHDMTGLGRDLALPQAAPLQDVGPGGGLYGIGAAQLALSLRCSNLRPGSGAFVASMECRSAGTWC
jgi:hypothetical protein